MNLINLPTDSSDFKKEDKHYRLLGTTIPSISLPNQDANLLKLNRFDTFRLVFFCYSMTGHPEKPLPEDWNNIPGASGCTLQNCSFRDGYDELINKNALPVGASTQSISDIKEMIKRLHIPYDIVSDQNLTLINKLNLPTFSIGDKKFFKRITFVIEKSIIKKIFYPINTPNNHINDVLNWLSKN